jgi:putative restriction endonuclease
MVSPLNLKQLFERVLRAVYESGWQAIVLDSRKPFRLRLFRGDEKRFDVRIYLWNCTHGGGAARAKDEYRVQLTGVVPSVATGEVTLFLG